MRHPDELLGKPHENALLDPDNVYILQRHLPCAAHEAPLRVPAKTCRRRAIGPDDEALFGPGFVDAMVGAGERAAIAALHGRKVGVHARATTRRRTSSLRDAEGDRFAVLNAAEQLPDDRGAERAAPRRMRVHPGAVYLHQGESYLVTEYNHDLRHAIVAAGDRATTTPSRASSTTCASCARCATGRRPAATGVPGPGARAQPGDRLPAPAAVQRGGAGRGAAGDAGDRVRDGGGVVGPAGRAAGATWPAAGSTSWAASMRPSTRPSASCRSSPCATGGTSAG